MVFGKVIKYQSYFQTNYRIVILNGSVEEILIKLQSKSPAESTFYDLLSK